MRVPLGYAQITLFTKTFSTSHVGVNSQAKFIHIGEKNMANPIDLSGATSLEQQGYLVALELQKQELAQPEESRPDNAQITFDTEASTVAVAYTLDTTLSVTGGNAVIGITPYLP